MSRKLKLFGVAMNVVAITSYLLVNLARPASPAFWSGIFLLGVAVFMLGFWITLGVALYRRERICPLKGER